jgi:tetratricopeptide (TPR) repeat protein
MRTTTSLLFSALLLPACASTGTSTRGAPTGSAAGTPERPILVTAAQHEEAGNALANRGDQDAAIAQFEEAVRLEPSNAMYQITFASWLNRWHVRGAAPHLDAARLLVQGDRAMLASIGHEYRLAGEFEACTKTFDDAIAAQDGGEVRTERALCRLGTHDERGADADLRSAVAVEPTYPQAHYFLGGRLAVAHRFKEAAAEYQAYLTLAPDGSLSDQATQRMQLAKDEGRSRENDSESIAAAAAREGSPKARR